MNATLPWDEMLAIVKRQLASAPAETDQILHDLFMAGWTAGIRDAVDLDEDGEA